MVLILLFRLHNLVSLSIIRRDRKRKRFVRETGKEDQKKKIRIDSGQVISNKKNKKNLYPFNKTSLVKCLLFLLLLFPHTLTIFSCIVDVVSLNDVSVMRSGRKNTSLMMEDLAQTEKQEEEEEAGGGQEEEEEEEVGKHV